jgi:hypothetical protein
MSTSSTTAILRGGPDTSNLPNRRHPTAPLITRERGSSAPPVMKTAPRSAKTATSVEADIARLLSQLSTSSAACEPVVATPASSGSAGSIAYRDALDEELDREIEAIFAMQLEKTLAETDEVRLLEALTLLLQMLPHTPPEQRKANLSQVIPLLQRTTARKESLRVAISMLDEFIAAHAHDSRETTSDDAEAFVEALHTATAAYPLAAQCQRVVYQLWAAKKLNCFAMAKISTDYLADIIGDHDDDTSARRIEQAVDHIATMPLKYRLMVAMALYQCAPDEANSKLRALEAIASKNLDLPDTIDAQDFCKIVNQQIYELRIAQ